MSECPLNLPPSAYNCTFPYPDCISSTGFQFSDLWQITLRIAACTSDVRLFDPSVPTVTQLACTAVAGHGWTYYPVGDIWNRLTTRKFPLLQLVALFPRPPLGVMKGTFVIVHLLGNPVGTLKNLLLKVASCQSRARYWRAFFKGHPDLVGERRLAAPETIWKSMAIIVDSCDEWGYAYGNSIQTSFREAWLKSKRLSRRSRRRFFTICREEANILSADRSTNALPVIFALLLFISTIGIAVGRTEGAAAAPDPQTFINIEAHSIAFSSLYFWVIPATLLGATIGSSSTENSMPRALRRLQRNLKLLHVRIEPLPSNSRGGIYSYYPENVRSNLIQELRTQSVAPPGPLLTRPPKRWLGPGSALMASVLLVVLCSATAVFISALVPPIGFGCRCIGEVAITAAWLLSALLDYVPLYAPVNKNEFVYIFIKNLIVTFATMGGVAATQVGVFNRCVCYTAWGWIGLALPQASSIANDLSTGIRLTYPAIAFGSIAVQLVVFPLLTFLWYRDAITVFLQRDDRFSHMRYIRKYVFSLRIGFKGHSQPLQGLLPTKTMPMMLKDRTRGQPEQNGMLDLEFFGGL